jgi:GMP synthase (glutamine-hydrolysing)
MVQALGGEIVHDPANTEVGTYELSLTEEGEIDPLLGHLPRSFHAQMGRKDRAERLPDGVANLASSDRAPYQALRIPGKPIWASQFHPELNRAENKLRFEQYLEGYSSHLTPEEQREALSGFLESSPEVHSLLERFLEIVFE